VKVKRKLRSGWRNDDEVLEQYFQGCYSNWKVYTGPRTPQQVLKLQSIYKQAIYGDNLNMSPSNLKSSEGVRWLAWSKLRGMPQVMAKRRFITYLSEIDPLLIDVMPDEKPPEGFPLDREVRDSRSRNTYRHHHY
jgi:acyl-CoA-binding protein